MHLPERFPTSSDTVVPSLTESYISSKHGVKTRGRTLWEILAGVCYVIGQLYRKKFTVPFQRRTYSAWLGRTTSPQRYGPRNWSIPNYSIYSSSNRLHDWTNGEYSLESELGNNSMHFILGSVSLSVPDKNWTICRRYLNWIYQGQH